MEKRRGGWPVAEENRVTTGTLPYTALRDAALMALRKAIVDGKLKPGHRVLEVEIARELGTSRAPVREAIRQLESEGLVVSSPHRGTYVTKLCRRDAREIFSLRAALEGLAVTLVVRSGQPEVLEQLDRLVDRMESCAAAGDMPGLTKADFHFHETLCRAADHKRMLGAWLSMSVQARALVSLTDLQYLVPEDVVRRHRVLVAAMRKGRAKRAMWLLTHDIMDVGERVAASLDGGPELDKN